MAVSRNHLQVEKSTRSTGVNARKYARRREKRREKRSFEKLGVIGIVLVVLVFGIVMYIRTENLSEDIEELEKTQQRLEQELKDEQLRAEELEERRVYVQTKMYVEEMAKKLGLVYPDEIIYRPDKQ